MSVTINGTTGIDTIQDGIVTTAKIAADAVTTPKIADTVNLGRRNRFINSAMLIDQRNSGSSWNATNGGFGLDRWKVNSYDGGAATGKFSVQRSSTAPDNFSNSLLVTSLATTADATNNIFNVEQLIEGYNTFDFAFGTSAAKTITISFWVRSSLTGTFGGAIKNSARNRAYPFTYTISSANTFEYKTITIAGDTSGTWVGATNGTGVWVSFGLGVGASRSGTAGAWNASDDFSADGATSVVGTSGATWYITGVQLEVGDTATPFEHRSYGEELNLCYRYYWTEVAYLQAYQVSTTDYSIIMKHPVEMRAAPTRSWTGATLYSQNISNASIAGNPGGTGTGFTRVYIRPASTGSIEHGQAFTIDAEL